MLDLTEEQAAQLLKNAPTSEKTRLLGLIEELNTRRLRARAQEDFIEYVKAVWPDFISGSHHQIGRAHV